MKKWFLVKVTYTKNFEDGKVKKVKEEHVFDAVNFTDAEKQMSEYMEGLVKEKIAYSEFDITDISKKEYSELLNFENGDPWFEAKVVAYTYDHDAERERKSTLKYLIEASDVEKVTAILNFKFEEYGDERMEIQTISKTKIEDVHVLQESDEEE